MPFDEIHIGPKWVVKAFPTCHRVPSVGYILYSKRHRLRGDLVGKDGAEIAALRKAGESVTSEELSPEIAYTGDMTIEVFTHAEERGFGDLLRVKVLITEVISDTLAGGLLGVRGWILGWVAEFSFS
jgi:ribonuclease Z